MKKWNKKCMIKLIMKKQARGRACRQAGFTLVELLVVIAIISILTVITVSQFNTARMRSRDVQRKGDLNGVYKALILYYSDYGEFPDPESDIGSEQINSLWEGRDFIGGDGYIYFKGMPHEKSYPAHPQYCYEISRDAVDDPIKKMALYAKLENVNDESFGGPYTCESGTDYNYVIYSPNAGPGDFND